MNAKDWEPSYMVLYYYLKLHPYTPERVLAQLWPGTDWAKRSIRCLQKEGRVTFSIGAKGEAVFHATDVPRGVIGWDK